MKSRRTTMLQEPNRVTRAVFLSLLLVLSGCGAPSVDDSLADARASMAESDLATANIHLRNALQAEATNVEARLLMADVAMQMGDSPAALAQLEWIQDAGAPIAIYAVQLARVYADLGRADQALALLDDAGLAESDDAIVWLIQADAWRSLGDYAASEAALGRAGDAGAPSTQVDLGRARTAYASGSRPEARQIIEGLLTASPGDPDALALRAALSAGRGEYAAAGADFEQAIDGFIAARQALKAAPLLLALVELRLTTGESEQAESAANRLAEILPDAPMSHYASAMVAYRAGRYSEAVADLRSAVAGAPDEVRFQSLLGAAHLALGNLGQAEQAFLSVLNRNRDNSAALRLLVETRLQQERPDAALQAVETYPNAMDETDVGLVGLRARASLLAGDAPGAVSSLERALEQSPGNQDLALALVEAHLRAGDADAASAVLEGVSGLTNSADLAANAAVLIARMQQDGEEAGREYVEALVSARPTDAAAHLAAALFYQLVGEFEAALSAVDQSLEFDAEFVTAHIFRGSLLQRSGDTAQAKLAYERAMSVSPENPTALAARAEIAVSEQDHSNAADLFRRAFAASSNWPLLANQALSLRLSGQLAWAEPIESWLNEMPDDLRAWMFLAEQRRIAGEDAAAILAYERIIALDEENLMALNNAAYIASSLGRNDAIQYARRAAELAPDNGAVLDTLGWILVRQSLVEDGLPILERATQLLPDEPEIQYHLGFAQVEMGDDEAARRTLNQLLAGDLPAEIRLEAQRLMGSL